MESSMRVHFEDGPNGLQPIIKVYLKDSDDSRDALLKTFFQALGGQSSWLFVSFDDVNDGRSDHTVQHITIHPVRPADLLEQSGLMKERGEGHVFAPYKQPPETAVSGGESSYDDTTTRR